MHVLGHSSKTAPPVFSAGPVGTFRPRLTLPYHQVAYGAGINEKLVGDFIRKHNVRDKVFSESITDCS